MAENMSLADQAVQALAMVKAMDAELSNSDPHRFVVRNMKRVAEQTIAAALRQAIDLAWLAQDVPRLVSETREECMRGVTEAKNA